MLDLGPRVCCLGDDATGVGGAEERREHVIADGREGGDVAQGLWWYLVSISVQCLIVARTIRLPASVERP